MITLELVHGFNCTPEEAIFLNCDRRQTIGWKIDKDGYLWGKYVPFGEKTLSIDMATPTLEIMQMLMEDIKISLPRIYEEKKL